MTEACLTFLFNVKLLNYVVFSNWTATKQHNNKCNSKCDFLCKEIFNICLPKTRTLNIQDILLQKRATIEK